MSPGICLFGGCTSGSTPYLAEEAGSLGRPITMTRPGGKAFELKSLSAAQNFNDDAAAAAGGFPNATAIYLVGTQAGGAQLTATLALPDTGFASYKLKDFKKLESVTFYGNNAGNTGGIAIDDIAVS